jgi:predicted transcriptional regulator
LIFIAIFVYLGAQAEAGVAELQSALEGLLVRDGMMTRYRTLESTDSVGKAVDELLAGSQQDFPVVESDRPIGILSRNDLVKALSQGTRNTLVGDAMNPDCGAVGEFDSLRRVVESMHARQCGSVPVVRDSRIVGLLTLENVNEMIVINTALERTEPGRRAR